MINDRRSHGKGSGAESQQRVFQAQAVFDDVQARTMKGRIYQVLREMIINGDLSPGSRLVERGLAVEFGTSKTPVREALLTLERERLVEIIPHLGAQVTTISAEEFREWLLILDVLESAALRHALEMAARGGQLAVKGLGDEEWLREMETARHAGDWSEYRNAQRCLQATLISSAQMPNLQQMISSTHAMLDRYFRRIIASDDALWDRDLEVNRLRLTSLRRGELEPLFRAVRDWHNAVIARAEANELTASG